MCTISSTSTATTATGPIDSGATSVLAALPTTGVITGDQMADTLRHATEDLDNSAAGLEHTDIMEWADKNRDRLSPEAKAMLDIYDKAALRSMGEGRTGIPQDRWDQMMKDVDALRPKAGDGTTDVSAQAAMDELEKKTQHLGLVYDGHHLVASDGMISGDQLEQAIENGTADLDSQAAGLEFETIRKWVSAHADKLSPDAQKVMEIYERYARAAQAAGRTGIPQEDWNKMIAEMKSVHPGAEPASTRSYSDEGAGQAIEGLSKRGLVSGSSLINAIDLGTSDEDAQAAGREFDDFRKWARDNADRLTGDAKKVMEIYESHARKAQQAGSTGIPSDDYKLMLTEMRAAVAPKPGPLETPQPQRI
jgi:hypothetical protein